MPQGICKMCLAHKELVESHLMPRALYNYCRSGDSEPIKVSSEIAMITSRQTKDYLLCFECEGVLNKGGEMWILPKLAAKDRKSFPLYEIISGTVPAFDEPDMKIYYGANIPGLEIAKITHFAMGLFWKAGVHSWEKDSKTSRIELGPYADKIRKYLIGDAAFPKHVSLSVNVTKPSKAANLFNDPHETFSKEGGYRTHFYYVPGVLFMLNIGRQISQELILGCFATNMYHPIVVSDGLHDHLEGVVRNMYLRVPKSKKLMEVKAQRAAQRATVTSSSE